MLIPDQTGKSYRLTPRDKLCLIWIGLQYAIRFDQLQRLLYRSTPEVDRNKLKPGVDYISIDRTYEVIRKWLALGLIEKDIILHNDKMWIWLSRQGLRESGLSFNYSGKPSSIKVPHRYYINQVRLAIESQRKNDIWQSEREILREQGLRSKGESKPHAPDGILTNAENGKVTAIEIEWNTKTDDELEDDLRELAANYRSIWYFCTPATRRQVEAKLEGFMPDMRKPFVFYNLEDYGHEYGI